MTKTPKFLLVLIITLFKMARCSKLFLYDEEVKGLPDILEFEPIYSQTDQEGFEKPRIEYSLTFTNGQNHNIFLVIGTRKYVSEGLTCSDNQVKNILSRQYEDGMVQTLKITNETKSLSGTFYIKKSGLYSSFLVSCEVENFNYNEKQPILVNGDISFVNKHGFLPAHKYPLKRIYMLLFIAYVFYTLFWYLLCLRYHQNLMNYHYAITVVLVGAMFEMIMHEIFILDYNKTGIRLHVVFLLAKGFYIVRKIACRLLILLIANGVGITKQEISQMLKQSMTLLGLLYFVTSSLLEMQKDFSVKNSVDFVSTVLTFILAVMDTIFYVWIFSSIRRTMKSLDERERYKKTLFRRFMMILFLGLLLSLVFSFLQLTFIRDRQWLLVQAWSIYWIYEMGFSEILFIYFTLAICYILSPSVNISEYQQIVSGDLENNTGGMIASGSEPNATDKRNSKPFDDSSDKASGKEDSDYSEDFNLSEIDTPNTDNSDNDNEAKDEPKNEEDNAETNDKEKSEETKGKTKNLLDDEIKAENGETHKKEIKKEDSLEEGEKDKNSGDDKKTKGDENSNNNLPTETEGTEKEVVKKQEDNK